MLPSISVPSLLFIQPPRRNALLLPMAGWAYVPELLMLTPSEKDHVVDWDELVALNIWWKCPSWGRYIRCFTMMNVPLRVKIGAAQYWWTCGHAQLYRGSDAALNTIDLRCNDVHTGESGWFTLTIGHGGYILSWWTQPAIYRLQCFPKHDRFKMQWCTHWWFWMIHPSNWLGWIYFSIESS